MVDKVAAISFWYGNWPEDDPSRGMDYVRRLKGSLYRNLTTEDVDFILITDSDNCNLVPPDIETKTLPLEYETLQWNLKKLYMFNDHSGLDSYDWIVCLDLDMVICGPVDFLFSGFGKDEKRMITCSGAYKPGMLGGSIVGFSPHSEWCERLTNSLRTKRYWWSRMTHGSERVFYRLFFTSGFVAAWQDLFPGKILSYKIDGGPKEDGSTSIVRFHGKPRPHQLLIQESPEWMIRNWRE